MAKEVWKALTLGHDFCTWHHLLCTVYLGILKAER